MDKSEADSEGDVRVKASIILFNVCPMGPAGLLKGDLRAAYPKVDFTRFAITGMPRDGDRRAACLSTPALAPVTSSGR